VADCEATTTTGAAAAGGACALRLRLDAYQYLWYVHDDDRSSYRHWLIGSSDTQCPFDDTGGIKIKDSDKDFEGAVSGKWSEWNGDTWKKNSNIKVKCAGD